MSGGPSRHVDRSACETNIVSRAIVSGASATASARVSATVYVVGEVTPRAAGYKPGDVEYGFGVEKRAGAHVFQLTFANSFGTTYGALARGSEATIKLKIGAAERSFYRLAVSVHYEVEHSNPNHADVEGCPFCGRTGEYAGLEGNLVERVHDPLGLELLMTGKIRGEAVKLEDWERRDVGSIDLLARDFEVAGRIFPAMSGDRNTLRIGIVVLSPKPGD